MGILEKISEIEKEIARTQKNKGQSVYLKLTLYCIIHSFLTCYFLISNRIPLGSSQSKTGKVPFTIVGTFKKGRRKR